MARWITLGFAVMGFGIAFAAKTPGALGFGLLLGLIGLCGFVVSMAAARVSASARPETMMASIEEHSLLGRAKASARAAPAPTPGVIHVSAASDQAPAGRPVHTDPTLRRNSN